MMALPGRARVTRRPANDGGPGERDAVRVEHVEGGSGPDVIVGNGASNSLEGQLGRDRIRGGAGDDRISGGEGEDVLDGGPGDDDLSSGDEQVLDFHRTIAFDRLRCGGGEDVTHVSLGDVVAADCEHVYFTDDSRPNLVIGPARVRLAEGRVSLFVANNDEGTTRASGTVRLFAAGRDRSPAGVLGSARMDRLEGGGSVRLVVRLKRSARRVLARRGRLLLRATLDARAGQAARSLTQRVVTVTR